jgi:ParB family transcriptional regulator, chromosome partitioning protein
MQTVNAHDANLNTNKNTSADDLPIALKEGTAEVLIPLKRLVASPYNQRKSKRAPASIEAIADNILAVNLLQNLVVHPMKAKAKKAPTYGVDAGETRRQALLLNVERGHITPDFLVRCIVISEAEAILASASENDIRVPPHPADQFIAYKALSDQGRSPEFIATVFKVSPKTVAGHLKLASVSPKLFDLFADDAMDLEQIKALAITDDHERQEAAWFGAQHEYQRRPNELRTRLKGDKLTFNDRTVRFVTVAAYEAAGGAVERDLFAQQDEGFILNPDVLMRLFDEKMASEVDKAKAQGWSWVEARPRFEHSDMLDFTHLPAEPAPLTDEQQARYEALEKRSQEITDKLDAHYEGEEGDEAHLSDEALDALEQEDEQICIEMRELDDRDGEYTPEQMKVSGAIVSINHQGTLQVVRGLVRREDRAEARAMMNQAGTDVPRSLTKKEKGAHSEKLLLNLTAHRTAAVQSALSQNPLVALVTIVHKLALDYLYNDYKSYGRDKLSVAQISSREAQYEMKRSAPDVDQTEHAIGLKGFVESCQAMLPKNPNLLFAWLLEQPQERLLNLLAVCTSLSINGVSRDEGPNAINAVAGALNLNLSAYWQPTRASYLDHVSKARIVAIVSEVVSKEEGERLAKMKKGEAAQAAEKLLEGKNWLPEFMGAAQVAEARFYDDEDEDDEDRAELGAAESNEEVSASDATAEEQPVSADVAPWPFPKAADVAPLLVAASEQPTDDESDSQAATPAIAWPFPSPNPHAARGVRLAA